MRGIWPWEGGVAFWQNSLPMRLPAERPLSPHLSVYRPLYTMVLSMTHRVTGLFLSVAGLGFVAWLAAAAAGPECYARAVACLSALPVRILLFLALAAFWYHLFAGIRHLAWDAGVGFSKAAARTSGALVVVLTLASLAATLWLTPAGRFLAGLP
jgi:succinate dehydrogenase / fumarate reductase cytochrome b subunit